MNVLSISFPTSLQLIYLIPKKATKKFLPTNYHNWNTLWAFNKHSIAIDDYRIYLKHSSKFNEIVKTPHIPLSEWKNNFYQAFFDAMIFGEWFVQEETMNLNQ